MTSSQVLVDVSGQTVRNRLLEGGANFCSQPSTVQLDSPFQHSSCNRLSPVIASTLLRLCREMQENWHARMCHPEGLHVPEIMGSFARLFYSKKKKDCLTLCFKVCFFFPSTTQMLFKPFKCHLILTHKAFLLKPKTC